MILLTGSIRPARGAMKPSSAAFWTAFSIDLSSWSTGAHSPRAASAKSLWAPSLAVAPADPDSYIQVFVGLLEKLDAF
ncbi:hypothetical protein V1477_002464 [Vespula maculifrons]|uniref:Uncharacterized protein n=1 Tax=Vespula maculifrons TaxID=7453 RepID=A0ABD2CXP8_VESMC